MGLGYEVLGGVCEQAKHVESGGVRVDDQEVSRVQKLERVINHCILHCRLAKFRGLMYRVKYGPVIGCVVRSQSKLQVMGVSQPLTAPYLTWYMKPRNFAKRQCKLQQWLTPPTECRGQGSGISAHLDQQHLGIEFECAATLQAVEEVLGEALRVVDELHGGEACLTVVAIFFFVRLPDGRHLALELGLFPVLRPRHALLGLNVCGFPSNSYAGNRQTPTEGGRKLVRTKVEV